MAFFLLSIFHSRPPPGVFLPSRPQLRMLRCQVGGKFHDKRHSQHVFISCLTPQKFSDQLPQLLNQQNILKSSTIKQVTQALCYLFSSCL